MAKNLDWSIDLGYVLINNPGEQKNALQGSGKTIKWVSRYTSITFNQFGKEFPLGGMNSMGLVMEELNMQQVKSVFDTARYSLNEFQLVQFILDNFRTVEEVIENLEKIQLDPILFTLHYFIADSYGNSAVIEYDGYKFRDYRSSETNLPVLSNNIYAESLRYLRNFQGFGGNLPIMNRKTSNDRFVTAANMLVNYRKSDPVDYSFGILDSVSQKDTRWSIVYDIKDLKVYIRFKGCKTVKIFKLTEVNPETEGITWGCDITNCAINNEKQLYAITRENNSYLLHQVLKLLSPTMDISGKYYLFNNMAEEGNRYLN